MVRKYLWFTSNVNPWNPITVNRRSCSRTSQNDPTCLHFFLKTTDRVSLKFILPAKDKSQQCQHVLTFKLLWKKKKEEEEILIQKVFQLAYWVQILDTICKVAVCTWWQLHTIFLISVRFVHMGKGCSLSELLWACFT